MEIDDQNLRRTHVGGKVRRKENFVADIEGKYGLSVIVEETSSIKFSDIGYTMQDGKLKTSQILMKSDPKLFFSNSPKIQEENNLKRMRNSF